MAAAQVLSQLPVRLGKTTPLQGMFHKSGGHPERRLARLTKSGTILLQLQVVSAESSQGCCPGGTMVWVHSGRGGGVMAIKVINLLKATIILQRRKKIMTAIQEAKQIACP